MRWRRRVCVCAVRGNSVRMEVLPPAFRPPSVSALAGACQRDSMSAPRAVRLSPARESVMRGCPSAQVMYRSRDYR